MIYLLVWLIGVCVGGVVVAALSVQKPSGTLKMDCSTGDPYLFLELSVPIEDILNKDSVVLNVDPTDIARR